VQVTGWLLGNASVWHTWFRTQKDTGLAGLVPLTSMVVQLTASSWACMMRKPATEAAKAPSITTATNTTSALQPMR
jgi:hypothetical protein